ncbi:hypothetical protein PVK64_19380 [Aliivibrio sp. S4TY2]|uniref:hypothetical protein n=1 Tax=unclassified Aliivibrio TaxID=2645654 RepID=UPI0023791779|nr:MULTISPECIES: hypothetical protein [unclassified Aliivibrio]MDD9158330.1 hypothetical protein [Aliivibrio sp. S4TY2]MDD9162300.1 hypothetical protein [Aliivibrio sp. S4TY1]MDD9166338.1 hypothetical protein [Aliivibrio sp. S4MY2]MDD9170336.1 hypothetical protein [Aliivibrio sp. S4MY4]MDD9187387.1 hypothetical protein [Aliivibrio sp. S4MY3]
MTTYELLAILTISLIHGVPLIKIAEQLGFKVDNFGKVCLICIPVLQLVFLIYIAFKSPLYIQVRTPDRTKAEKNKDDWKTNS